MARHGRAAATARAMLDAAAPLMRRLLLAPAPGTGFVWTQGLQPGMALRDVLAAGEATR